MVGASASSAWPSARVRFATERRVRSPQRIEYGKEGMSDMWMPAHTTVPPLAVTASAAGTSCPTGAKDDGGVERFGWLSGWLAGPLGPELSGERRRALVA